LLPGPHDLALDELETLARTIADDRALWQPLVRHDPDERHYAQLYRDLHVDV
jgi:hypothetical protein